MSLVSGTSKIEIISQAFTLIGKPRPVIDLNESAITASVAKIYDSTLLDVLGRHPWRFALRIATLVKLISNPPLERWQFAYQLPTQYLTAYRTDPLADYEIYGNQIFTNVDDPLRLVYVSKVSEAEFPAYFAELMKRQLASIIAIPFAENPTLAQFLKQEADSYFIRGRHTDAQAFTNDFVRQNEIFSAHFRL